MTKTATPHAADGTPLRERETVAKEKGMGIVLGWLGIALWSPIGLLVSWGGSGFSGYPWEAEHAWIPIACLGCSTLLVLVIVVPQWLNDREVRRRFGPLRVELLSPVERDMPLRLRVEREVLEETTVDSLEVSLMFVERTAGQTGCLDGPGACYFDEKVLWSSTLRNLQGARLPAQDRIHVDVAFLMPDDRALRDRADREHEVPDTVVEQMREVCWQVRILTRLSNGFKCTSDFGPIPVETPAKPPEDHRPPLDTERRFPGVAWPL